MKTTIDAAGRILIPKALRRKLGLHRGSTVEICVRDERLEIDPAPTQMKLVRHRGLRVANPHSNLPALTDKIVRDAIDRLRR